MRRFTEDIDLDTIVNELSEMHWFQKLQKKEKKRAMQLYLMPLRITYENGSEYRGSLMEVYGHNLQDDGFNSCDEVKFAKIGKNIDGKEQLQIKIKRPSGMYCLLHTHEVCLIRCHFNENPDKVRPKESYYEKMCGKDWKVDCLSYYGKSKTAKFYVWFITLINTMAFTELRKD